MPPKIQEKQKISDEVIIKLAQLGKKIHHHYYFPQDIEWAYANKKIYITQSRPITTLNKDSSEKPQTSSFQHLASILKGAPASPGIITGPVRIVPDVKHLEKVKKGDIMVTDMTTPDFVPAMRRELGVPCIVGTTTATKVLLDGMIVTLNGSSGEVFKGGPRLGSVTLKPVVDEFASHHHSLKTATHIYVNLAEVELAETMAAKNVDGVGLLRAEFMIANIGVHPKKMIAEGKSHEYINKLAHDIGIFCKAFHPRPVIYRATDFKTNEYKALKGGDKYEPEDKISRRV